MSSKRIVEIGIVVALLVGAYWLGTQQVKAPEALPAPAVGEAESPLLGLVLPVPEHADLEVTLATTTPDTGFPMGRYEAADGPERGSLVALDTFMASTTDGVVVPIAHNAGGSGEFVFLAHFTGTIENLTHRAYYPLGDRVEVEAVTTEGDTVIVTYRTHELGQALAERPGQLTSKTITLGTVSDPDAAEPTPTPDEVATTPSSIAGDYTWEETQYADGERIAPREPEQFVLSLLPDGGVAAQTDCNQISGSYRMTPEDGSINFDPLAMTEMACQSDDDLPSQDQQFAEMLSAARWYHVLSDGTLELELADGEGVMTLTPQR